MRIHAVRKIIRFSIRKGLCVNALLGKIFMGFFEVVKFRLERLFWRKLSERSTSGSTLKTSSSVLKLAQLDFF